MPAPPPRPAAPAAPTHDPDRTILEPLATPGGRVVAVLVGVDGSLEGRVFPVFEGENRLGRGESCRVRLPSQRISRDHATLTCEPGRFSLEAVSERNPTRVDGQVTRSTEIRDGNTLTLGDSTFRFVTVYRT
jgi:pSer/pThr/pTyr-binding forkhead associated (FHA) protein